MVNLEDDVGTSRFLRELNFKQLFGAHADGDNVTYTAVSRDWFDLSLISSFGRNEADRRKLINGRTLSGANLRRSWIRIHGGAMLFTSSTTDRTARRRSYLLHRWSGVANETMGILDQLRCELESTGLIVNVLPSATDVDRAPG